jgi:hypothetical protein
VLGRELHITWARGERPPKHAVAHGALKMAQALAGAAGTPAAMALPVGIGCGLSAGFHLDWHDLFGPVTERNANLRDRVLDDTVTFDFDELQRRIVLASVLAQAPPTARDADGVVRQALLAAQNRCGGITPTGYLRGPLQLLIEYWTRRLAG